MKARIMSFVVAASLATFPAVAQNAKPLKTKKNTSIALVNLLNPKPDCSANVVPIADRLFGRNRLMALFK